MDYKEKYEQALEKAKQNCLYPVNKPFISTLEEIFPELAESEDERIRKEIVEFIKRTDKGQAIILDDDDVKGWIAWLKKQKQPTNEENEQGKADVLWCINQARKNAKDENEMGTCWFAEKWLEKQGEQKPVE